MVVFIYDNTWTGFLTAVFEVYDRGEKLVQITSQKRFMPDAFATQVHVETNEIKAKRVWCGLSKKISAQALKKLYTCFLSELQNIENVLFVYMRLIFAMDNSPEHAYADANVLKVSQVDKMVHREKHRMEAFVRFRLTKDHLYYAGIEPDFNVLPLLLNHFKNRYADQQWLIYDLKRDYGIYYNLYKVEEVTLKFSEEVNDAEKKEFFFHEDEALYQTLWKDYFKHVNIKERKNNKLHLQHVPKRYWKHLTEKIL